MSKDAIDIALGARLRKLRVERQLSLSAIGRQLGVSYQQVTKYEEGINRISAATLYRLAEVLGVDVNTFFDGMSGSANDNGVTVEGDLDRALSLIADEDVRHQIGSLFRVLAARR